MGTLSNHAVEPIVLTNDERIDSMSFDLPLQFYCPLGTDMCAALAHVTMELGEYYPEHYAMFGYIRGICATASTTAPKTLEQLIFEVGSFLLDAYKPQSVALTVEMLPKEGSAYTYPLSMSKKFMKTIDIR